MELLEGETLRQRLTRLGPLPPQEMVPLVAQIAKALGRAHQLGIVHRDIKPDNIFLLNLEGETFVKVLDFGIAKQQSNSTMEMTQTGNILGTPLYMSPEQFVSARRVDLRADLWSLGVVTYKALTNELPFRGATLGELMLALNSGAFTAPSQVRPELPPAVDAWMARALALDPAERFGSARELSDALELAVMGEACTPHRMAAAARDGAPRRARLVLAAAAAGVAFLGGGIFAATRTSTMAGGDLPPDSAGAPTREPATATPVESTISPASQASAAAVDVRPAAGAPPPVASSTTAPIARAGNAPGEARAASKPDRVRAAPAPAQSSKPPTAPIHEQEDNDVGF
jgi:serine/threonine-protein kinase